MGIYRDFCGTLRTFVGLTPSSRTPVFEEAEIVTFLDSISPNALKDIRDKAIFCVLLYSWCRVSALINLTVADYYERGGTRWLRFQEKRGKDTRYRCTQRLKKRSIFLILLELTNFIL